MSRLIWTRSALADVQRLYRFLDHKDSEAARRAVKAIRTGVKVLARKNTPLSWDAPRSRRAAA